MASEATLDNSIILSLKDIMGEDFALLVNTYMTDARERLSALEQALTVSDFRKLQTIAHSFKGSSSNLGARHLSLLCGELESHAAAGDLATLPASVTAIGDELNRVVIALQNELLHINS